ncbi:MAG: MBL fold metallo-hydrolase [Cyclobacteriaceae bacterium]|nr:MBL fold metallo-hydrolase [Cyclobacteriaceae bacterium]
MTVKQFVFNAFSENTYVIYDSTGECIIIDPGCYDSHEKAELKQFIKENKLTVKKLINTHCHIDHVLGNNFVKQTFGVSLHIHKTDEPTLKSNEIVAAMFGFNGYEQTTADVYLEEGEDLTFGNSSLKVLFVPGHAPGHIALVNVDEKICISGDVLFHQSIGRTDLPGGDFDTLIKSIHTKLFTLPDDVKVYCGHGPATNIGFGKHHNPFCGIGKYL